MQEQLSHLAIAPQLSARMQFDGYLILRDIYISSRSHVFLAEDCDSNTKVVIKTPSTEMRQNQDYLECLLMEDCQAN